MTERLTSYVWARQRLTTRRLLLAGGPAAAAAWIEVVYPGRHVATAGPDFSEAILALPDRTLLHGDVEVHARSSGWHAHGHGRNPAYGRVVAHVVLWHDAGCPTVRPDGREVPVVELAHLLPASLEELAEEADGEGGEAEAPWHGACCADWRDQGFTPLLPILDQAGRERLERRAAALAERMATLGEGQAFLEGWLGGVNYGPNQAAGRRLAGLAPLDLLRRATALGPPEARGALLEALLLGAAGLLPDPSAPAAAHQDAAPLTGLWRQAGGFAVAQPMERAAWQTFRVRPDAHPVRRLVGAARWLAPRLPHPEQTAVAAVAGWQPGDDLATLFVMPAPPAWQQRLDFGRPCPRPRPLLVGTGHARTLAACFLLPYALAWARRHGDQGLASQARRAYAAFPSLAPDQVTRHMLGQLSGAPSALWANGATRHQGLHHLHAAWCRVRDCAACPVGQATGRANFAPAAIAGTMEGDM